MKSEVIKKPFRFLKNVMRWYQREADNIIKEIRKEIITPELWKKAEENFKRRGMPVPIYENHNEEQVVGSVEDIEAREDGLYVIAHRLFEKGKYLVEKEEYPLPSGDFVLHYDDYGNIVNIEIFGVSLVNSEGAKDVEPVTMNKSEESAYSVNRVIKAGNGFDINKKNKGDVSMQKEEVLEFLNDEEFLKSLPDDIIAKIIALKDGKDEEEEVVEEKKANKKASQNKEEDDGEEEVVEEKKANKKASQNKDEEDEEEVSQSKTPEEVQAIIDEVVAIMKDAGASEEDIAKAIDKLNGLKEEEEVSQNKEEEDEEDKKVSVEAKKANKTEDEEDEDESKKSEQASMSKFEDMIAMHEARTGARVVPSSVGNAKKLLRKTRAFMGKKAYKIAFDELSFVGGRTVEKAYMSKQARKTGDIVKDILSY